MSFWGIEIKPGKPFVLHRHDTPGKIQITQATLGTGILTKRSVVQCNISGKSPVLLCALLPDKIESLSLNHQFDEEDDVTFSVLGPRSVHLTGFYCESGRGRLGADGDSDSESYGVDIVETDNEADQSADSEEEDNLDDFIVDDDDDIEMSPPSKGRKSVAVEIEDTDDDEKPTNKKGKRRHLKKKYQVSDSEVDEVEIGVKDLCEVSGSEDEDVVPISHLIKKKATSESKGEANSDSEIQLAKENKEGNGSSDPDTFEILKVSEAEQISELPKDSSADIDQESNVKAKKRKKRSRGEDGDTKTEQDHDRVELKPKEEQPSAIPSKDSSVPSADIVLESDAKPKKKSRRNRGEDGAKAKNMDQDCVRVKPEEGQPSDRLESDVTPKKKHGRNRGEDGDAKTKTMDLNLAGVEPEKEQLTDMVCGEDVNAKNENMDQDPVEIKTRKNQANDKIINSAGHVSNQDNGEVKKKKKKKKAQKSAENVCDEEDKK
ncbi:hypothetical protein MKW98_024976 [Papaver atlanticum]|uniref:peptidylprolyl isomerase n=1 Tax=Papaver atlanticum TaxID=357466 RepID=A0AAD4T1Z7_9MAGN|nr:hypothetical protein MKW98_024976 [Papaver atlanticum]